MTEKRNIKKIKINPKNILTNQFFCGIILPALKSAGKYARVAELADAHV